jgi:sugar phosphate isomerase/epimerase
MSGHIGAIVNPSDKKVSRLAMSPVRAIAMWDFSWLERRWSGAGYEDWDRALDELAERGYDAVRIDVFPHLVGADAARTWTLLPVWDQQEWGSPAVNTVQVQPALNEFIRRCHARGIRVALSSWFREDRENTRMHLKSPEAFAKAWLSTLDTIVDAGLLDALLYVDFCNEWPGDVWAPYFRNTPPELTWGGWYTDVSMHWMRTVVGMVRERYPQLPLCFSFDGLEDRRYLESDLSFFDLIEHHCWMAKENDGEFAKLAGYGYERFSPQGYNNLAEHGERLYRENPAYWQGLLTKRIASLADVSCRTGLPLATTECWGVVDYKDWPRLDWAWVKELCEIGTLTAAATGAWAAIATSNFCGPQFAGMWNDIAWHQRLTKRIKASVCLYPHTGSKR